jgi:hypothetical protein
VLGVVDGEPKNYSGVNGSYGVGDRLQIRLTTADDPSPKVLFFHLNWNQDLKDFGILILEDLEVHSDRQGGVIPTKHSYLYFKKDEIKIEKIDTTISLHRYYKSDHDGFIVNGPTFGSQNQHLIRINSVDCRTETNNLMDLLQYGKLKTEWSMNQGHDIQKLTLITFLLVSVSTSSFAQNKIYVVGAGTDLCAVMLDKLQQGPLGSFVYGSWLAAYVSGRNRESVQQKGNGLSADDFLAITRQLCSRNLGGAVWESADKMYEEELR